MLCEGVREACCASPLLRARKKRSEKLAARLRLLHVGDCEKEEILCQNSDKCDDNAECSIDWDDVMHCKCKKGYEGNGESCTKVSISVEEAKDLSMEDEIGYEDGFEASFAFEQELFESPPNLSETAENEIEIGAQNYGNDVQFSTYLLVAMICVLAFGSGYYVSSRKKQQYTPLMDGNQSIEMQ